MVTDKENILHQQETELNTMTDPLPPAQPTMANQDLTANDKLSNEKVIIIDLDDKKQTTNKVTDTTAAAAAAATATNSTATTITTPTSAATPVAAEILTTELIDLNSKNNTITEIIQAKEVSPKKTIPKFTPLVSESYEIYKYMLIMLLL